LAKTNILPSLTIEKGTPQKVPKTKLLLGIEAGREREVGD